MKPQFWRVSHPHRSRVTRAQFVAAGSGLHVRTKFQLIGGRGIVRLAGLWGSVECVVEYRSKYAAMRLVRDISRATAKRWNLKTKESV